MVIDEDYIDQQPKKPIEFYRRWAYKNTTLLAINLLLFWYFANFRIDNLSNFLGRWRLLRLVLR